MRTAHLAFVICRTAGAELFSMPTSGGIIEDRSIMKSSQRAWSSCSVAALSLAVPALALAADDAVLEEVVVTAQKRTERLIDVPMSITAISGDEVIQRGLNSVQDLAFAVPGMATRE